MAYAALMSLKHITDEILGLEDLDLRYFPFSLEAVKPFQETIVSLLTFLDDCPPICSHRVNDLITEIRDASYEVEDILESLKATHFLRKYGSDGSGRLKRVAEMGFKQIVEKLETIKMEVSKIQLGGCDVHELRVPALAGSFMSVSIRSKTKKEALDKDLETKLKERLVGGFSKIDVIPIVGMGGIGKTTLARILYDSQLIKESFDIRGWSIVSQIYDIQEIVTNILKEIGVPLDRKKDCEQHLYQSLWGRKYLIVLDDVWDTQTWDDIKRLFPDNNNGSRIILTTRDSNLAGYADSFITYHEMKLLNEDSSWSLLCQEIFPKNNCPSELVEIGKKIARQCQGLPLVISAIGGHIKKEKHTEEYWKYVSENISSVLTTTNDPSLDILTLSYNYLPHHLKACFLYFGCYPEDRSINVVTLVRLWVAEGFVEPRTSNSMEEVAEQYLEEVVDRNLVLVDVYGPLRTLKRVFIHDLFREICTREAKKEKFLCISNTDIPLDVMEIYSQRRLILMPDIKEDVESACSSIVSGDGSFSAIRSLFCYDEQTFPSTIIPSLGLLKVLTVGMKSMKFPVEILELVNLKYLQLGLVSEIPSSISRLRNLQTLFAHCLDGQFLPSEIWEMPQLRHLLVFGFHLPEIPDVLGKGTNAYVLENLKTLWWIFDFSCTQEVAAIIPNLKDLHIDYTTSFHSTNSLVHFRKLESLCCNFIDYPKDNILPNCFFPSSLKKIELRTCQIPWEQLTIIGVLPNLEVLILEEEAMVGNLWETNEGEFKQLKFLMIGESDLVEWKTEKDHFPRLVHLLLRCCKALEAIPSEIGEIPTLEMILLCRCSPAAESSAKEMLGEDSDINLKFAETNLLDRCALACS